MTTNGEAVQPGLLEPSPAIDNDSPAPLHTNDNPRKRPADGAAIDPRPAQYSAFAAANDHELSGETGATTTTTTGAQPKRVPAPGATQAAIAKLKQLRAQGAIPSQQPPAGNPEFQDADAATSLASAARQPSINSRRNIKAPHVPTNLTSTLNRQGSGPVRVPAPGATQAALARLAALKNGTASNGAAANNGLPPLAAAAVQQRANTNQNSYLVVSGGPHSDPHFMVGSVVWAKMQSYPWWPAQVQRPSPEQNRLKHGAGDIFIVFHGTADYTWLSKTDLRPFSIARPDYSRYASAKNKQLQRAIDEAWVYLGQPRPDVFGKFPNAYPAQGGITGGYQHLQNHVGAGHLGYQRY